MNSLLHRYHREGATSGSDEAIQLGQKFSAPLQCVFKRFLRRKEISDREQAISLGAESISYLCEHAVNHGLLLARFAPVLISSWKGKGNLSDLDQAIRMMREAYISASGNYNVQQISLTALGTYLGIRFEKW